MGGAGGSGTDAVGLASLEGEAPPAGAGWRGGAGGGVKLGLVAVAGGFAALAASGGGDEACWAGFGGVLPRLNTPFRPATAEGDFEGRDGVACNITPVRGATVIGEIDWPHFGQLGNWPMQCWQSGEPHAWRTDAIPPQPMHRGARAAGPTGVCPVPPGAPGDSAGVVSGAK